MKMPDRPGGAGGSLIRANLFDAEDTPPFSRTRSGENIIHKRNGDLLVTRAKDTATIPPWLMVPYSYNSTIDLPFERLFHRFGTDGNEERVDQATGSTVANQETARGTVFVGDGFVLELYQVNPARTLHLRLRPMDALEEAIELGLTIQPFAEGFAFSLGVSLCALGYRDEENGYAFAAFYYNVPSGKYVYAVGSTAKGEIGAPTELPELTADGWWTPSTYASEPPALADYGYHKCYAVGRGHMVALMTPRLEIEYERSGGVPEFKPYAGFLPPDGAPQILHTRDFGDSWTMDPAQYLTEAGVFEAADVTDEEDPVLYDVPVRYVPWLSNFYASPIGGGRVAIAAGGHTTSPPMDGDNEVWPFDIEAQTMRFFVSGSGGAGFSNRPWPLDEGRNNFPDAIAPPGVVTLTMPLFGYNASNIYSMGSMGPGTFFALFTKVSRTTPGPTYGTYPASFPLLACVTRDFGSTWATEQIPSAVVPFSATFYENKALWDGTGTPITAEFDTWLYYWLGICVTAESDAEGRGGEVAFFTGELDGPLAVSITDGKETFANMSTVALEDSTRWTPHPSRVVGIPLLVHTGDELSDFHPETVRVGYPEFEDRT